MYSFIVYKDIEYRYEFFALKQIHFKNIICNGFNLEVSVEKKKSLNFLWKKKIYQKGVVCDP